MAGSYNHIVDDNGDLLDNDDFVEMIENLGDAYEMAKQMYGMIWYLALRIGGEDNPIISQRVEEARQNYRYGLEVAKALQSKGKVRT